MDRSILPVESIQERDIDLILLEEFSTDQSFCEWFVKELNLPFLTGINGAWRSITDFGLGETDILFSYNSDNKKVFILIENKLDASFQKNQSKRYKNRVEKYISNKQCDIALTVLIAPKLYCENQNEFEIFITYEAIINRLEFTGSKRNLFKSKLLQIANEKLRRGYQPVNSIPVQKFWHSYWKYKQEKHPSLQMTEPVVIPHGSDWPMLFDDELKNIIFYHKLGQGNTDATFKGFSKEVEIKLQENVPEWAKFIKHGKAFSLRIFSGKVDRAKEFTEQIESVENGIRNLEKLRNWIKENKNWLQ